MAKEIGSPYCYMKQIETNRKNNKKYQYYKVRTIQVAGEWEVEGSNPVTLKQDIYFLHIFIQDKSISKNYIYSAFTITTHF